MSKVRSYFLSLLFIGVLFSFGIYTISKEPEVISLTENREMAVFQVPTLQSIVDTTFQTNTDKAFSDQIAFRQFFLKIYQKMNNVLTKIVYLFIEDDRMTLYPISDDGVFKVGSNGEYLVEFPYLQSSEYDAQISGRIQNYNDLQAMYPELSMYIYKVTNARDTHWFDEANEVVGAGTYYRQWMIDNLDPRIKYNETEYLNWEEYQEKNYKTDHHWNVYGAYQGYSDIITMLGKDYPQIGTPREPTNSFCSTALFYGSLVKRSNFNLDEKITDTICDFDYEMPEYTVTVNKEKVEEYGARLAYRQNHYDADKATNHYREFFGKDSAEVIYDFGNNTGVNAVIISDSYTNAIKPVLASHFDKTIFIDLRYYLSEFDEFFNLSAYMEKYDIDLVVWVGGLTTVYMDESFNINN